MFLQRLHQQRRTVHFQETLEQVAERNLVVEALVDQNQEHLEVDQSQKDLKNLVDQNLTEHNQRVWWEQLEVVRQAAGQPSVLLLERLVEFDHSQLHPGLSPLSQSPPMQQYLCFGWLMDREHLQGEQMAPVEEKIVCRPEGFLH